MGELEEFAKLVVDANVSGIDVQTIGGNGVIVSDKHGSRRGTLAEWHTALRVALDMKGESNGKS